MTALVAALPPLMPGRRTLLYLYTAIEIVLGSAVLAWAVLTVPLTPAISFTTAGSGDPRQAAMVIGLAFWSAFGLLGGTRVGSIQGYGVLTFHMPFIVAAAALGGPAAGGVVALIATTELRELRDAPWYGLLANHSALAFSGVASGLVMLAARAPLAGVGVDPEAVALLAFALGAAVFVIVSVSLATMTSLLRDAITGREVVLAYASTFRTTMLTEIAVGWLLALTYRTVGWWAPVGVAIVVVRFLELGRSPFIRYQELREYVDSIGRKVMPVGYLIIRLEIWQAMVDACGRGVAEQLADGIDQAIGEALFIADRGARKLDGEWHVLLPMVRIDGAEIAARKYHARISERLAADAVLCPAIADLKVRIGVGIEDEGGRRGPHARALAEQAVFHAAREHLSIVIRTTRSQTICQV